MDRVNYLKTEVKRVNDELIKLLQFSLSSDPSVQSLQTYKKKLFDEIKKLVN